MVQKIFNRSIFDPYWPPGEKRWSWALKHVSFAIFTWERHRESKGENSSIQKFFVIPHPGNPLDIDFQPVSDIDPF